MKIRLDCFIFGGILAALILVFSSSSASATLSISSFPRLSPIGRLAPIIDLIPSIESVPTIHPLDPLPSIPLSEVTITPTASLTPFPTVTLTSTPTITPTVALTPSVTSSPSSTPTPTSTPTVTSIPTPIIVKVVINEFMPKPYDDQDWVEIYNNSSDSVDISGWKTADKTGVFYTFGSGTIIDAGTFIIITKYKRLDNRGDTIYLKNAIDEEINRTSYTGAEVFEDQSIGRNPDGEGAWKPCVVSSKGSSNNSSC